MIQIEKLYKSFGNIQVLKDINLTIKEGEKIVILGPSGSGKSTLIRCLNLLEEYDKGKIYFKNQDIKLIEDYREKIGMVFQNFNLFSNLTVWENITLAPIILKTDESKKIEENAKKMLNQVKLLDKKDKYPKTLSGGEKQRIAIIRALIMNPAIMLFDEPTSALDPELVKEVLNLIKEIADTGMTMVIITHQISFAKEIADKIVFMDSGKILEVTNSEQFFINPKTQRAKVFLKNLY